MPFSSLVGLSVGLIVIAIGSRSRASALLCVIVSAPFQGLGFLGNDSNSVPVFALALAVFIARSILDYRAKSRFSSFVGMSRQSGRLLLVFYIYCLFVTVASPVFFAGIEVFIPRLGLEEQVLAPSQLQWQISNAAQAIYLSLNVLFVIGALYGVPSLLPSDFERGINMAFIVIGVVLVASAIPGAMEILSQLLYNYAYSPDIKPYQLDGGRLFMPFLEPSMAGAFVAACGSYFLARLSGQSPQAMNAMCGVVIAVVLLINIGSASAIIASVFSGILVIACAVIVGLMRGRLYRPVLIVVAGIGVATIAVFGTSVGDEILELAYTGKLDTDSYTVRSASNKHGWEVLAETFYLGAGLGSNRVSSLALTLLSSVGVVGLALFALLFLVPLVRAYMKPAVNEALFPAAAFTLTFLLAGIIAVPDISFPFLWVGLAWMTLTAHTA